MSVEGILDAPGPKKLLSIDGGGIRGVLAIEILARIEDLLRAELSAGAEFVLADYFDFIGGTSTGAIVAAGLARGMSARELRRFYVEEGPRIFRAAPVWLRPWYKYRSDHLSAILREVFGKDTLLGDSTLRTLLLIVLTSAWGHSAWPITNNPRSKYGSPSRMDSHLRFPLWRLLRASSAAPTFFPAETLTFSESDHQVTALDGGITYNNPALLLYLLATSEPYGVRWPTGEHQILLISVGTGMGPRPFIARTAWGMHFLHHAMMLSTAFLARETIYQDMLCRMFGRCLAGPVIDSEVGDLVGVPGSVPPRLFTYCRYNVELTAQRFYELGLSDIDPYAVSKLDSIHNLPELQEIGRRAAAISVRREHFAGFV